MSPRCELTGDVIDTQSSGLRLASPRGAFDEGEILREDAVNGRGLVRIARGASRHVKRDRDERPSERLDARAWIKKLVAKRGGKRGLVRRKEGEGSLDSVVGDCELLFAKGEPRKEVSTTRVGSGY